MVERKQTTASKVATGVLVAAVVGKLAYDAIKFLSKPSEGEEISRVVENSDDELENEKAKM